MKVFANGNEVACEDGDGKVVAAFPDVCMSPPPPPAGPVPVPYPNTSSCRDMKQGTKKVTINGKPVMLRDQSFYVSSPLGNEAATRNFGGGVVTHTITGKTYFASWSMDVHMEGKNVTRHVDLTTSNHASYPGSTPPYPNLSSMQLLAHQRIKLKQCPCCGEAGCAAAFREGDEPLSLEDFYGVNEKDGNGNPTPRARRRDDILATMRAMKEKECTCEGRVFPEPPCDVFRARGAIVTGSIETAWKGQIENTLTGQRINISTLYQESFFKKNPGIVERFVAMNPQEEPPRVRNGFKKVNHLTPKAAGGCPTNAVNLQPDDLLCGVCKKLDAEFTDWQAGSPEQWHEHFRASGASRARLTGYTPSSWARPKPR